MKRIAALDMLRGYALVAIMVDHMPDGVLRGFTLARFAVFDAAELFVLLSGFLVGLVWISVEAKQGRRAAQLRFLKRAIQVWFALVLGGVLVALLSRGLFEIGFDHTAIWSQYSRWIIENPLGYVGTLGLMWLQPNLLDVLALYVVVLAFTPITLPLMLRFPFAFAAGSVLVWYFAIPLNEMLPNHRADGGMLFNPFGWQLLFYTGVAMGAFREQIMPVLRRNSRAFAVVALIGLIGMALLTQLWRMGPQGAELLASIKELIGPIDKWSLDWVRYVGILISAWLVAIPFAPAFAWLAETRLGRALGVIGRGGLVTFVTCVMLSVIGDALMSLPDGAGTGYRLSVDIWTIGALWLAGILADRYSPRGKPKPAAPLPGPPTAAH